MTPAVNGDGPTIVAYEVPGAARRVHERVLLDVSAVSPLHWLDNNFGSAEVNGILRLPSGGPVTGTVASATVRIPGAQEVRVDGDGQQITFSGRVSTYDEAGIVALLPAAAVLDAPETSSADGRSSRALFQHATDERSLGRVPDGEPGPDSGAPWLVIGLGAISLALAGSVVWFLRRRGHL